MDYVRKHICILVTSEIITLDLVSVTFSQQEVSKWEKGYEVKNIVYARYGMIA